ncbi:MAG: rhamnulokinase [Frankiales bacterium]|nr:rhamnulokinase [Frankiales bacterium]
MSRHAAVDLGASSGRVVVADVTPDSLTLQEIHRFTNGPVRHVDGLHWDATRLYREGLHGLRAAGRVDSVGIDSWAVDYGLLSTQGALINEPWSHRDSRTDNVSLPLSRAELFARNGLQHLPFTTVYQLGVDAEVACAATLLLIPDLLTYWFTGTVGCELTNASTTGLLDVRTRQWSPELLAAAGVCEGQLGPLVEPGQLRGSIRGLRTDVVAVGSHDTASAFVGAPLTSPDSICISLGTWGLVGFELPAPVLTPEAFAANFTNELGVDGRVRFLRNVMGLWVLQECLREWRRHDLAALLEQAAARPRGPVVALDSLLAPGDMPARVCTLAGAQLDQVGVVRCVVDSLVDALARTVAEAAGLAAREVDAVHVVGGGAQNALVCQLLATALGLPVLAGPVEATALGNVLVQARAIGTLHGTLEDLRALVRRTFRVVRYDP